MFHDFVGNGDVDWRQFTFEAEIEIGAGLITNTMSYREVDAFSSADVDSRETAALITFYDLDQEQFSNELRYNVTLRDRWDLTVGASYFSQEYDYMTGLVVGATGLDFDKSEGRGHRRGGGQLDQTSMSFYFDNEYRLTDNFALIGGFNISRDEKDVKIVPRLPPATIAANDNVMVQALADVCDYAAGCDFSRAVPADDKWTNFSPKFGFTWSAGEDMQIYGHWSRAYRSGFYNFRQTNIALLIPGSSGNGPEPTDEEEHNAFEIGMKSRFMDGNLVVNAAYFFQDVQDLARSTGFTLPADGSTAQDLINVGDAELAGFELDMTARFGENLVVQLAAGYVDGDITDAKSDIDRRGDGITPADESLALVRLSEWTANASVTYDVLIGEANALTLAADYGYRSEAAARDENPAFFPRQNMIGASVRYGPVDGKWSVSTYGKNLRNDVVYRTIFTVSQGRTYAPLAEGRRYGIEFRYEL